MFTIVFIFVILSNAKIQYTGITVNIKKNIGWFDIAVDDIISVCIGERFTDLRDNI
ncbi:MAG: hypothetical protein KZQ64_11300 [gamma proteobacterium symbiont of Bathyaustriella thionipta]|nr:hypothetical protein [gamma proteobacterium symbiont of Bathyaustriella thionipta]MCU7953958.1 hypothetical protein [gamma proteobacterium symbiont of Bathyaustriella thionipta]